MATRKRHFQASRVRRRHCYTMAELADLLGAYIRTIQNWHKAGMTPIDETQRPMLFLGSAVRSFLENRRKSRRHTLQPGQMFCLRCQSGRWSEAESLGFEFTGKVVGKDDEQVLVTGKCDSCGAKLVQFGTHRSLLQGIWTVQFQQARKGLYGTNQPPCNTDLTEGC